MVSLGGSGNNTNITIQFSPQCPMFNSQSTCVTQKLISFQNIVHKDNVAIRYILIFSSVVIVLIFLFYLCEKIISSLQQAIFFWTFDNESNCSSIHEESITVQDENLPCCSLEGNFETESLLHGKNNECKRNEHVIQINSHPLENIPKAPSTVLYTEEVKSSTSNVSHVVTISKGECSSLHNSANGTEHGTNSQKLLTTYSETTGTATTYL